MDFRILDNGRVDFHTERVKKTSSNENGEDAMLVEDIGPQEEGDYSVVPVQQSTCLYFTIWLFLLITLVFSQVSEGERGRRGEKRI